MKIPLATKSDELNASEVSSERLVNWFAEPGGKTGVSLNPTPGLSLFSTLIPPEGSGVRAMYTTATGRLFVIAGNRCWELDTDGSIKRVITNVFTNSGPIGMTDNGTQLFISEPDTAQGICILLSDNSGHTITGFNGGLVTYHDGYFIANTPGTQLFQISALNNGQSWSAFDTKTADGSTDELLRIIKNGSDLWMFGARSTECWYNSGNSFPMSLIQGSESNIGTIANKETSVAVTQIHNKVFWVSASGEGKGIVYMNEGYVPVRISTYAIEEAMAKMTDVTDVVVWAYQSRGHIFVMLNFSTDEQTWCYDLTTGLWHERSFFNAEEGILDPTERHRGQCQAFFNGKNYVGDYELNLIYELSDTTYTDNGEIIQRICETPTIHADRKRVFFPNVELDLERGVGLTSGQGSDPQISLEVSNDAGKTWGPEDWKSAGKLGEYETRVKWNRLGSARSRSFRFTVSDPVEWVLIAAYSDVKVGNG